jgi:hypothetical protein
MPNLDQVIGPFQSIDTASSRIEFVSVSVLLVCLNGAAFIRGLPSRVIIAVVCDGRSTKVSVFVDFASVAAVQCYEVAFLGALA